MSKIISARLLLSFATLLVAALVVIGATFAFFSDTETSVGNTFAAGELDLGIDNHSFYNGVLNPETTWRVDYDLSDNPPRQFFNFDDVKPNDFGEDTISLHVKTNDAWLCADVTLTSDNDNGFNEPETDSGDLTPGPVGGGELADNIEFLWWADDGDNVMEVGETPLPAGAIGALDVDETATVALADSQNNIWGTPGPFPGDTVRFIAKAWCYGPITAAPLAQDGSTNARNPDTDNNADQAVNSLDGGFACDGSDETNIGQTDSFTADISFRAIQSRNNPTFLCDQPEETPTPTPPTIACTENDNIFAASVVASAQGLRKDGTAVTADRDDPADALGVPQHPLALPSDSPVVADSFFSLGFPHANNGNIPGSIELDMGEVFYPNAAGDDLFVYEVTGGAYPDEIVQVYAKLNLGDGWSLLGSVTRDDGVELSAGGLTSARYVRLVEASVAVFPSDADGYDLDAVKAFCTAVPPT